MKARNAGRWLRDHFTAHRGNGYHPRVFRRKAIVAALFGFLLIESAYLTHTKFLLHIEGFTAAVVPAVIEGLTNEERLASGTGTLARDPLLEKAALLKAQDMAQRGYFAHVSPDGKEPWHWLEKVGYPYRFAGENLAVDFEDSADVQRAWMDSPAHRANVLKREYTHIGVATAQGTYRGRPATFVVQFFGTPRSSYAAAGRAAAANPAARTQPSSGSRVLGAAVQERALAEANPPTEEGVETAADLSVIEYVLASPKRGAWYFFGGAASFISLILATALLTHSRARRLEVAGGGAVFIAALLFLMFYNEQTAPRVQVSSDTQAASAAVAF